MTHCCEHDNNKHKETQEPQEGGVWTCPMHPEVLRDRPGMCPECGMNLVPAKAGHAKHDDHNKHAGHKTESFLRKFVISLVLTIPVVLYSEITPEVFGWEPSAFFGSQYLPFIFGTIVFFYCGWIFLASAYRELRARVPGMMTFGRVFLQHIRDAFSSRPHAILGTDDFDYDYAFRALD